MLVLLSVCLCCCHCRVTLRRAGAGCCFRVLLCALCAMDGSCCRCRRCQSGVCASERAYAGAAARCCHQSSLYSLCFGVWLLVPLQGASVRVLFALWSFVASAARCRVLLEGCAVRELFALWSLVRAPASLRATPNASLQATSRNHTLLKLWTLTLGNTDFITLGNTANIVLIIIT